MNNEPGLTRRDFVTMMSLAGVSLSLGGIPKAMAAPVGAPKTTVEAKKGMPVYFFSKPLDSFDTEFIAAVLAGAGLDGVDLSVRRGGKVLPERADTDLPKAAEIFKQHKLALGMMVTDITGPDTPNAEKVLKAASAAGIGHYRLGYYDYDFKTGIMESLQKAKAKLRDLVPLNKQYEIQAGYQNHSGIRVGGAVWDVYELIHELPVEQVSSQYDIRHAATEASASWPLGMRLLRPHIGSLAMKDFTWEVSGRKAKLVSVPMGEGIVDFDAYFKIIKELNIQAPITLHAEYPLLVSEEESLSLAEKQKIITAKLKKDVDYVRTQLSKYQLA